MIFFFSSFFILIPHYARLPSFEKNIFLIFIYSGKLRSSILQALFRLTEIEEGSILYDNADIHQLGLQLLRENLSIIP